MEMRKYIINTKQEKVTTKGKAKKMWHNFSSKQRKIMIQI